MANRDDRGASVTVTFARPLLVGVATAALMLVVGYGLERWRLGGSDEAAAARVERVVRRQLDALTGSLRRTAATLTATAGPLLAPSDADVTPQLFAIVETTQRTSPDDLSITIYGPDGAAIAWSGRPSELPRDRIGGPAAFFVAPGPLGLRLVHIAPVTDTAAAGSSEAPRRTGTLAIERVLSANTNVRHPNADRFALATSIASVELRARYEGAGEGHAAHVFLLRDATGAPFLEGRIDPAALVHARQQWRRVVNGIALAILAVAVVVLGGGALDRARIARAWPAYGGWLSGAAAAIVAARLLLLRALPLASSGQSPLSTAAYASTALGPLLRSPADLALTAMAAMGLVALGFDAAWRLHRALGRHRRLVHASVAAFSSFVLVQIAAGALVTAMAFVYVRFLGDTIRSTTTDPLHFSLHPWNPARLALLVGLLVFHAAALWSGVLVLATGLIPWRLRSRMDATTWPIVVVWAAALTVAAVVARRSQPDLPIGPAIVLALASMLLALTARLWVRWYRRASQVTRLVALFLALLVPAALTYPAIVRFADRAKRELIESQYARQAEMHPQELQTRLATSLTQIDAIPALADLVESLEPAAGAAQTDTAFAVWRQTQLADFRLTSAIEIYGTDGSLISRFALNFPEYAPTTQKWQGTACAWDVFGEVTPFGSEERRMLHAERAICARTAAGAPRVVGALVVHVMLDYGTLPFLSSQNPYFELFRADRDIPREGTPGRDVELVIYGWGRLPIYASTARAWPLDEALFGRIAASREAFWTELRRDGERYRVFFSNDRAGVYALGYPIPTLFNHLVLLAELSTLAGVLYVLLVAASVAFARLARGRARFGRALIHEVRASFYRKLFLAFVAASVVPALTLALLIRAYFTARLRADVEAEAARTAAVAQRVIEESVALQRRAEEPAPTVSDDVMVWISQVIDQDVNIFDGPRLVATSERDLFASGLLPTRTPGDVYRAIALQRLPSYVGADEVGDFPYILAAAPVRTAGRDAILTVPLALRQQEIEREIDDLDRGVLLGALVFVLLGAGIGVSMAERIADPVERLTNATRRIAGGDFDARISVRSTDELQRLVDAFNAMAAELKRQREQLERTHRLEAWAEMARQVAHEIKNPLTPIQLAAEHLDRVHRDRGEPLSPVLESCLASILSQVRLLRQIASEFSSFASSPTAQPSLTDLRELLADVVDPYRPGLEGRIDLVLAVDARLPRIVVDRTLIARALTNIIENALHAMPGRGRLAIEATTADNHVAIAIADTGVGMDEDAMARVFEPYFSTKAIGTGLGLTLAKRNVELNGGRIEVRSRKGKGTTVTLWLPAGAAPPPAHGGA